MLFNKAKIKIKLIFIYLISCVIFNDIFNFAFATNLEKTITVYYCKITDGTMGYYDRPCQYVIDSKINNINNSKHLNNLQQANNSKSNPQLQLITEKLLAFKMLERTNNLSRSSNSIQQELTVNHKIYDKILNKHSNNEQVKNLSTKRCQNALNKIPLITELLEKHQALTVKQNNKAIIVKLKRSLTRYNRIKKLYCENQKNIHNNNFSAQTLDKDY